MFGHLNHGSVQKLFRKGKIKVNKKKVKASYLINENDSLIVYSNFTKSETDCSKDSEKDLQHQKKLKQLYDEMLIFETDDFIAINKQPGLAVQLGSKLNFCLETILKSVLDQYFLVHRLDKNTSGVLLVAKTLVAARTLTQFFKEGKIKKTYWAIVDGKLKSSGVIKNYITKSTSTDKMTIAKDNQGQLAITKYKPLNRVGYFTLIELKPHTGRKHQLRVHCADELKSPILGDIKYNKNVQHNHLFLHAKVLEIPELNIKIEADLPVYFKDMLEQNI